MRLLVCGGRNFSDEKWLGAHLDAIHAENPGLVIACGYNPEDKRFQGADQVAYEWAKDRGVHGSVFPAHWDDLDAPGARVVTPKYKGARPYNAAAGPQRNQRMFDTFKPDRVLAAPGDKGTANMCRIARVAGVPVQQIIAHAESEEYQCNFDEGWYRGRCVRPAELGGMCRAHAAEICSGCGAPATYSCGHPGTFACGVLRCDTCDCPAAANAGGPGSHGWKWGKLEQNALTGDEADREHREWTRELEEASAARRAAAADTSGR